MKRRIFEAIRVILPLTPLVILFFMLSPVVFGEEPPSVQGALSGGGIAPGTNLARILNKPQIVSSLVYGEALEDKSKWITMDADVHVVIDKPFELMRAQAREMENYSRIFKWFKSTELIKSDEGVFLKTLISVGVFGITVNTNNTMRVVEAADTPERFLMDFTWHAGDGLVQPDMTGQWYYEPVTVKGIAGTYVRYIAHGTIIKKYPFQETFMRMRVNSEHVDLMKQLMKASRERKDPLSDPPGDAPERGSGEV